MSTEQDGRGVDVSDWKGKKDRMIVDSCRTCTSYTYTYKGHLIRKFRQDLNKELVQGVRLIRRSPAMEKGDPCTELGQAIYADANSGS